MTDTDLELDESVDPRNGRARGAAGSPGTAQSERDEDLVRSAPWGSEPEEPGAVGVAAAGSEVSDDGDTDDRPPPGEFVRPLLAAALATSAAGLVAGGIFGSWPARATGFAGAFAGAAWAFVALRSKRSNLVQAAFPFALVAASAALLVPRGESPGAMVELVREAVESGRLFRPPVPYDPGWTPILFVVTALIGFAAAWVGTAFGRPKLAVALPLPIVGLTAITQPDDGQFIAGIVAFVPILAAVAVLFGGDTDRASELDTRFEVKRALRSVLAAIPVLALLVVVGNTSFLFPEPVYDPTEQPQKPKAIPLSAAEDRVLFEVRTSSDLTGPWRAGVLDVYDTDDEFWKSPPRELVELRADGVLTPTRADSEQFEVTIVIRDLGNTSVFPTVAGTTRVTFAAARPDAVRYDTRSQLLRVETGRVPTETTYTLAVPPYPTGDQLAAAAAGKGERFEAQLAAPAAPPTVRQLLAEAPTTPWARLDFVRQRLLSNVVAAGAGTPVAVPAKRVAEMLEVDAEATPYEIVAAEALLARWAGVPARIGFGFDGLNAEDDALTVRPRNSAQWLEVYFDGFGWTPLIGTPQQAKSSLDPDQVRFDPSVQPSDDIAVEIYLPFERENLQQLYERIREQLLRWAPVAAALAFGWLTWPFFAKTYRRAKRRSWAAAVGPRAQVAVEYAEFRDLATDLNVADIYSTPLEYLFEVRDDDEHTEFAWLVTRVLYGDLARAAGADEVAAAESMSASLRRRLQSGQPLQSQVLALLSRASLRQPYSTEMPNVATLRLRRLLPVDAVRAAGLRLRRRSARPAITGS